MKNSKVIDGVQQYDLDSWQDFFSLTQQLFTKEPAYIYRGQANYNWPLVSSIDRLEKKYPHRKYLSASAKPQYFQSPPLEEEEHLNAFRRAILGRRGSNPAPLDDDACWVLGQHHGLATPLLDWTRSPFIALFFAFEEECVRDDENKYIEPKFREVFGLSTSVLCETEGKVKVVSPLCDDNYRLTSQDSILVKIPRQIDLEAFVRKQWHSDTHRPILRKFCIPNTNNDRHDCLAALNKMGINHMRLFPDISGAARYVNSLWEPGHEDLIAWE